MMSAEKVIEVKSLHKRFKTVHAVNNISFELERGDIFAFLGPNGAGKTTTLRILLDIIKADQGEILWNLNGNQNNLPDSSLIGYLPEERGLYTDLPVLRSLVYLASIRGMESAKAHAAAMEWLDRMGLADRAKEKLQTLSKGNQQKVQFIASIVHKPAFAILDEPFSGLDPLNQELFIEYIRELNAQGCTVLLSSHQMQLVEKIARKIFLINHGKELYKGSLSGIYNAFGLQHTLELSFEGEVPMEQIKKIKGTELVSGTDSSGVRVVFNAEKKLPEIMKDFSTLDGITNIKSQNSSLHDIFLELVKNKS
ncbi:MAG: ATP-binding cassette domain-containing protein [Bacteroidales bacterium]|nr:ATP-binding cassette domain-containing protein [Bacteroidales bacterium]